MKYDQSGENYLFDSDAYVDDKDMITVIFQLIGMFQDILITCDLNFYSNNNLPN
jgi:hypothetical protein